MKISIRPSYIAYVFHIAFTRPYIRIGDETVHTRWGHSDIGIPKGTTISAGFSYRFNLNQRLGETTVPWPDKDPDEIVAVLGPLNSSHFKVWTK